MSPESVPGGLNPSSSSHSGESGDNGGGDSTRTFLTGLLFLSPEARTWSLRMLDLGDLVREVSMIPGVLGVFLRNGLDDMAGGMAPVCLLCWPCSIRLR